MKDISYITNAESAFVDKLYQEFKQDPSSIDSGWRTFFEGFEFGQNGKNIAPQAEAGSGAVSEEFKVLSIIHGFRTRGHLLSTTNPIRKRKDRKPHLNLSDYGLDDSDLQNVYAAGAEIGLQDATLEQILTKMHRIYTSNIGFEYTHIEDREKRMWLRRRIEERNLSDDFGISLDKKKRILQKLNGAVVFEKFLHTKYLAQKRFSLEGGETTIAALDAIISRASEDLVEEVVIGMAHRGRLNVLANIMGKTYEQIFNEFEGMAVPDLAFGDGDVKYHLGYSSQVQNEKGKTVNLKLVPNPSHLEAVNPVVQGFARAKADILYKSEYDHILPILIHGDAAIAGQGVSYETSQMSKLKGYRTGGTLHFVINNQIGFTTDFDDARSSTYATAPAMLVQAPVFHVNGDDPEAVVFAAELAVEYRQKFNNDVYIDMVCYRRHGHNEGDDPKFTQPKMYELIKVHPNPREVYTAELSERGDVERELVKEMEDNFWRELQARLDLVKEQQLPYEYQEPEQAWRKLKKTTDANDFSTSPVTGITKKKALGILEKVHTLPEGFKSLRGVQRLLKTKRKLLEHNKLDWAMGELLAYGSLLSEGRNIRMSGQDVRRGTFSHRHTSFFDAESYEEHNRLNELSEDQGAFHIYNSLLSEFAVLGFEYGYSLATPETLVIWEAQFGDFYNGAQVVVDQFITAGESKWRRMSGLFMLLPHGYEGQGPEHSSARLERFLQSSAQFNITVANLTTPANFFHIIRRQLRRPFRKPLVIMSPKSLLRHPLCLSDVSEVIGKSKFREVLDDPSIKNPRKVKRVLYCSGKIYYDLLAHQHEHKVADIAIVRLEQLYPFPESQLAPIVEKYNGAESYWVQEEPLNMGAWQYILSFKYIKDLNLISRKTSASPATGFKKVHDEEQSRIVANAFSIG